MKNKTRPMVNEQKKADVNDLTMQADASGKASDAQPLMGGYAMCQILNPKGSFSCTFKLFAHL